MCIQESADTVRAAYVQRFFTASELRKGENFRRLFRYNFNEAQRVLCANSGGNTVFYRPVGLNCPMGLFLIRLSVDFSLRKASFEFKFTAEVLYEI